MSVIVPTVTAENEQEFANQLSLVTSFCSRVHIDLMDGIFAPSRSPLMHHIRYPIFTKLDIHLMYQNPTEVLPIVIGWNPSLIIVHSEISTTPSDIKEIVPNNIKIGLALLPDTSVESQAYKIQTADYCLVFGGHLGYHGGSANLDMLNKIPIIRNINPNIEIAWDGGANLDNIQQIATAGVDVINVGGAIHGSNNPNQSYHQLINKLRNN
ncbi:MAG: hypothetical protein MUF85_00715 [Patescibacteria group bacterium]|jgi:ribulose-phosphate 3-epimerase|nr:hypothetical protein [Patescibacteria group bacterium]